MSKKNIEYDQNIVNALKALPTPNVSETPIPIGIGFFVFKNNTFYEF